MAPERPRVIGRRTPQRDAGDKVTGRLQYAGDVYLPGMLFAKILRSSHAHARIRSIDTSRAAELPGVKAVITWRDLPDKLSGRTVRDERFLAKDKVTFAGEAVAAVAGVDEDTAEDALDLVEVDYEELPGVYDAVEARKPGAPLVHDDPASYDYIANAWGRIWFATRETARGNVCSTFKLRRGDVEEGFRIADVVIEETYRHPMAHHVPMEPHATVASVEPSGQVTVWTSSQTPYGLRELLAEYFDLPASRIRILGMKVGGGWGAKIDPTLEPLCIALSMKTRRPVRIVLTRAEEFVAVGGRRQASIWVKSGVMRDGRIVAREVEQIWTAGHRTGGVGAHAGMFGYVGVGPYRIDSIKLDSELVYTNQVAPRAFRGLGVPQVAWAIEQHTDVLAHAIGMDAVQFRLRNCVVNGDIAPWGEPFEDVNLKEGLEAAAKAIGWDRPRGRYTGRGVAVGFKWTTGGTFSRAQVWMAEDGSVTVLTGLPEIGQGAETVLAQIAAEELGVQATDVKVVCVDTDHPAYDMGAFSSRGTIHAGNAVRTAAQQVRGKVLALAQQTLGVPAESLRLERGRVCFGPPPGHGALLARLLAGQGAVIGDGMFRGKKASRYDPDTGATDVVCAEWKYFASAVDLTVDPDTGVVTMNKVVSAHDVGRSLNPQAVEGQIIGGVVQAVGASLMELVVFDEGRIVNPSFMHYLLPTADTTPTEIEPIVFESEGGVGPYGAKGVGEPPIVTVSAATGNALFAVTGTRFHDLPLTPDVVLEALERARAAAAVTPPAPEMPSTTKRR